MELTSRLEMSITSSSIPASTTRVQIAAQLRLPEWPYDIENRPWIGLTLIGERAVTVATCQRE
jgi:hypothetical protein